MTEAFKLKITDIPYQPKEKLSQACADFFEDLLRQSYDENDPNFISLTKCYQETQATATTSQSTPTKTLHPSQNDSFEIIDVVHLGVAENGGKSDQLMAGNHLRSQNVLGKGERRFDNGVSESSADSLKGSYVECCDVSEKVPVLGSKPSDSSVNEERCLDEVTNNLFRIIKLHCETGSPTSSDDTFLGNSFYTADNDLDDNGFTIVENHYNASLTNPEHYPVPLSLKQRFCNFVLDKVNAYVRRLLLASGYVERNISPNIGFSTSRFSMVTNVSPDLEYIRNYLHSQGDTQTLDDFSRTIIGGDFAHCINVSKHALIFSVIVAINSIMLIKFVLWDYMLCYLI